MFYSTEALWLLDEGYRIEDLDRAMTDWGMPMGPIALTDEVGIDVAFKVAHILRDAFSDRLPLPDWLDKAPASSGRLGTKNGKGFYRYEGRERKEPDPERLRPPRPQPRVENPDPGLIADRMVLPMVNEAARCLEERCGEERRRRRPRAHLRHRLSPPSAAASAAGRTRRAWAGSWPRWSAWRAPWATASRPRRRCAGRRRRAASTRGFLRETRRRARD